MKDQNLQYSYLLKSASEIRTRFFNSSFKDPKLEENYLSHLIQNLKYLTVTIMILCNLMYIFMVFYGVFFINNKVIFIVNSLCLLITLTLIIIYFFIESPYVKSYIEITCFFILSISLIADSYGFMEMDTELFRILRLISALIILKNLSLLIWSQSNFFVWLLFSTLHITFLILCKFIFENLDSSFTSEIILELCSSLISFIIKKFFDSVLRITFLERIKFQKYFDYNKKLINCMSGLHITFSGDQMIYMNDNTKNLLTSLMKNKINFKGNLFFIF